MTDRLQSTSILTLSCKPTLAILSVWDLVYRNYVCARSLSLYMFVSLCGCVKVNHPNSSVLVSFKDGGQSNRHLTQANFTYSCHDNRKQTENENILYFHNGSSVSLPSSLSHSGQMMGEIGHFFPPSLWNSLSLSLPLFSIFVFTFNHGWLNFFTFSLSFFSCLACWKPRGGRAWKQSSS